MYFFIENNGTPQQLTVSDFLKDYLEATYGATIETSVGRSEEPVSVFNEDGKLVAAFNNSPDEAVLNFHFAALT
ncbi:hypothetical protein CL614_03685 [archaeon]|nr:hypothetical protein [archaeon]